MYDIVTAESLTELVGSLGDAVPSLRAGEIERRLSRVRAIADRDYRFDILEDFTDEAVADIFVRVNSHGKSLRATDLALATLSARWPGVLAKMQEEAARLAAMDYPDLDVGFLTRALSGVVLGRGLSAWSYGQLARATDEVLEEGWRVVTRGVGHLVPLLKNNLRVPHSKLLPSIIVLVPAVVFLGSRPHEPLDADTRNGLLYWLLTATIRNRYSGHTDTLLSQDIPVARSDDPIFKLLRNLGVLRTRVAVTEQSLAGRGRGSSYFFLSYLATRRRGATDWWYGTEIVPGGAGMQALEGHHVHPQATLKDRYTKQEINDLANIVFISKMANDKIGSRSPREYFPELGDDELRAHLVPVADGLRAAEAYAAFLRERRRLLAEGMTEVLDAYRPSWLAEAGAEPSEEPGDPLTGATLNLDMYASDWETERKLVVRAELLGVSWQAVVAVRELESALADLEGGTPSNVTVAGDEVPVTVDGERVDVPIGPFRVYGSLAEWRRMLEHEAADARPLSECPDVVATPWDGELLDFPVTNSE